MAGQPRQTSIPGRLRVTYVTKYHHDRAGCLDAITYPSGAKLVATCDSNNRVKTLTVDGGGVVVKDVTYEPSGQVRTITYGNGIKTSFGYDARGRTTSISAPDTLQLSYSYDGANNVVRIASFAPNSWSRVMAYDGAQRLSSVTADDGVTEYFYDALGNRGATRRGADIVDYSYAGNNRLTALHGPVASIETKTFTWNAAGRLETSSDGAVYRYDGLDRRVEKTDGQGTTVYHYDAGGHLLAETTATGDKIAEYVYLAGHLVALDRCATATTRSCSNREWYHTDTLGSVLAQTNTAGGRIAAFAYGAWGERRAAPVAAGDRQYNGRVYDAGTGFHDYGARLYWPEIGRFISADTYAGDIGNPVSLNRYSYVHNNPYKYVDPTGRETQLAVGLNTANNVFGHVAIIINGQVYSYGTNYTQGGKYAQDWGGDASAYLDAQASARQTQLMTLATDAGQESALKAHLDANNPNAKGAPKYDLLSNSCVTVSEDALVAAGVLPNQIVLPNALNTPPPGSKWAKATPPGDLGSKAKTAGIVKDSKTVGTSAGLTGQSASGTVRAASDRSSP